ncbi:MAG: HNH endonuclease [Anaerolineales bacterium]|nr:HNH endonuclease [Anaerolineales bacterium]
MAERAGNRCEYCQIPASFSVKAFEVEHIFPRVKGGSTILSNLAFACPGCNSFKHMKTTGHDPVSREVVPLYNPRQDKWREHFAWSDDVLQMIGLTAIGRATIVTLHLNRPGLVNLRQALFAVSEHPPRENDLSDSS